MRRCSYTHSNETYLESPVLPPFAVVSILLVIVITCFVPSPVRVPDAQLPMLISEEQKILCL